jgi:hypothetical protein
MKTYRPKLAQIVKTTDIGEIVPSISYTPCTYGAFGEQLEFDFGPDFSSPATELDSDTNSTLKQPSSPCEQDGFIGIKEDTE